MTEILAALVMTHITIVCVTLYWHRSLCHKGVEFHPTISHMMRFWLWLTAGMNTKQWVAVHRKHHQLTDVEGDPHSPHVFGIKTVMTTGMLLYNTASKDANFVMQYGKGTPKDLIERRLYTPHPKLGIILMLFIDVILFGAAGFFVWLTQILWIPFVAAGMINGLGHWVGYRNGETKDHSHNISPIGIIIAGEELHNNHHLEPANPKFSRKFWEFDIGWMYINTLVSLRLAKLR